MTFSKKDEHRWLFIYINKKVLGLMGLRSLKKLRFLRLDGLNHIPNIVKSALLLEEALPNLTILGIDFEEALHKLESDNELLKNDRVLLDAKGKLFLK